MNWKTDCAVVVPCLNEERAIAPLITAVREFLPQIFVVDDGSTDRTAVEAAHAGAEVLLHKQARGKGAALQTGWNRVRECGFTWALSLDGDGQHAASDIPKFLECAERTSAPLIVGNRMHDAAAMPRVRRFVNRWMSGRLSRAAGVPLPDSQCGFRLMHVDTWSTLPIRAAHFEIESDTLVAFAARGCRIEFVPVQVIYKAEQSKIHPVRDTVRWFKWWRAARNGLTQRPQSAQRAPETSTSGSSEPLRPSRPLREAPFLREAP